jgi:Methyltransferase FkbM domain
MPPKASSGDFFGRFREVISDPVNLLIERVPVAGFVDGDQVYLHNGLRVPIAGEGAYYGSFSHLLVINRGVHEPLEEYVFQQVLKRLPDAPSMIELGAYWGHYSMWFKKERPKGETILVEPEAVCLKAGQDNFARNGFKGEFIQAFVGAGKFEIDEFFRNRKIRKLDILHCDIQGFEVEMLQGADNVLTRRRVDYLFVSTHSQQIHAEIVRRLDAIGYRVEISSDFDLETTSYDGFVFASSPEVSPVFGDVSILGREQLSQARPADVLKALAALHGGALPAETPTSTV